MSHDDGKKNEDIEKADIILLGVSRTGKHQHQYIWQTGDIKHLIYLWFLNKAFQTNFNKKRK